MDVEIPAISTLKWFSFFGTSANLKFHSSLMLPSLEYGGHHFVYRRTSTWGAEISVSTHDDVKLFQILFD